MTYSVFAIAPYANNNNRGGIKILGAGLTSEEAARIMAENRRKYDLGWSLVRRADKTLQFESEAA